MARQPRIHFDGANYHVFSRGNAGKDVFIDDADKRFFLALLLDAKRRMKLRCHAYCVMTNHFHLLLEVGHIPLSQIMQSILSRYSQYFNFKYETFGHVFQGRHHALICLRDNYFLELIRYIHLNPVAAGIVATPDEWSWSSHRCLDWGTPDPLVDRTTSLSMFGNDLTAAAVSYREFIGAGIPADFELTGFEAPPSAKEIKPMTDLIPLAELIAKSATISIGQLQSPTQMRRVTAARHKFVIAAWQSGFGTTEIARFLGCSTGGVAKVLKRKSVPSVHLSEPDPSV